MKDPPFEPPWSFFHYDQVEKLTKWLRENPGGANLYLASNGERQAYTLLTWACHKNAAMCVRALLPAGAYLTMKDPYDVLPMVAATANNSVRAATALLDLGADPNTTDVHGESVLIKAVYLEYREMCILLIERGADVNRAANDLSTPLTRALFSRRISMIPLLLDAGADVNERKWPRQTEYTPLILACTSLEAEDVLPVINQLLDAGADVNLPDGNATKAPPLYWAIHRGQEVIQLLIERGADVNLGSALTGKTPLMRASENGIDFSADDLVNPTMFGVVRLLIHHNADIDAVDSAGRTALMYACANMDLAMVQLLSMCGADRGKKTRLREEPDRLVTAPKFAIDLLNKARDDNAQGVQNDAKINKLERIVDFFQKTDPGMSPEGEPGGTSVYSSLLIFAYLGLRDELTAFLRTSDIAQRSSFFRRARSSADALPYPGTSPFDLFAASFGLGGAFNLGLPLVTEAAISGQDRARRNELRAYCSRIRFSWTPAGHNLFHPSQRNMVAFLLVVALRLGQRQGLPRLPPEVWFLILGCFDRQSLKFGPLPIASNFGPLGTGLSDGVRGASGKGANFIRASSVPDPPLEFHEAYLRCMESVAALPSGAVPGFGVDGAPGQVQRAAAEIVSILSDGASRYRTVAVGDNVLRLRHGSTILFEAGVALYNLMHLPDEEKGDVFAAVRAPLPVAPDARGLTRAITV